MPGPDSSAAPPSLAWTAARHGLASALAQAAIALLVVVACWLPDAGVSGHPGSALKSALLVFLTAQHGGISLAGTSATLVPLGMTMIAAWIAWRGGRWLADAVIDAAAPALAAYRALAMQCAGFAVACLALASVSRLGTTAVWPPGAAIAGFLSYGLVATAALVSATSLREPFLALISVPAWSGIRAGLAALCVYLLGGTVLALGSFLLHAGTAMNLSRQVGGGLSGLPIVVLGAAMVPNAIVAGVGYLAGPGFAVGSGTAVNAFATTHGVLPAFPLLAALPTGHGANPVVLALMALVPLAAGYVVVSSIGRAGVAGTTDTLIALAGSAAAVAAPLATLTWLGGGSMGGGRLRTIGGSPWQIPLTAAATVVVVALVGFGARGVWRWLVHARPVGGSATSPAWRELALTGVRRPAASASGDQTVGDQTVVAGTGDQTVVAGTGDATGTGSGRDTGETTGEAAEPDEPPGDVQRAV